MNNERDVSQDIIKLCWKVVNVWGSVYNYKYVFK